MNEDGRHGWFRESRGKETRSESVALLYLRAVRLPARLVKLRALASDSQGTELLRPEQARRSASG